MQEQPSRGVLRKRCTENMLCNFIEIALRHGCSSVNLLHIFRRSFPKNTSGWLILYTVLKIFVTPSVLFIISTWTLVDQDFYSQFPMSLDWRLDICSFRMLYNGSNMSLGDTGTIVTQSGQRDVLWVFFR